MRALWNKDAPWWLLFAIGGTIALSAAIGDGGFLHAFAFESGRNEIEFHTAWICGLALGLVAALFDTALGVRDYLRQRPLSASRLFWHRLRVVATVLAIWFVAAPLFGVVWMALFEATLGFDPRAVVMLWIAFLPAISACAIGLFAATLPVTWWLRPLVAGSAFLVVFSAIDRLVRIESGYTSVPLFVTLHLATAVLFGVLAWTVRGVVFDADLPLAVRARGALSAAVIAVAVFAGGGFAAAERSAQWWLFFEYPVVVVHEGEAKLADRTSRWRGDGVVFLDAAHAPTGETAERSRTRDVEHGWRMSDREWLGFDAPRWHRGLQSARHRTTSIYLTWDGRVLLSESLVAGAPLEPSGKGPERAAFATPNRLYQIYGDGDWVFVHERDARSVHRYDPQLRYFVPVELPDGDRLVDVDYVEPAFAFFARGEKRSHKLALRGENGAYVPRGDTLVKAPLEEPGPRGADRIPAVVRGGPIVATVELAADGDRPAFSHEFRPRTTFERLYAGVAVFCAAVQPPVFNLFARPLWLALTSLGVGLSCAWLAVVRLRRRGAPRPVRRYWGVLCFVFGPVALLLAQLLERRRMHQPRPVTAPPPPRILTPLPAMEAAR